VSLVDTKGAPVSLGSVPWRRLQVPVYFGDLGNLLVRVPLVVVRVRTSCTMAEQREGASLVASSDYRSFGTQASLHCQLLVLTLDALDHIVAE